MSLRRLFRLIKLLYVGLAGVVLMVMTLTIFVDVFGRYVFNSPIEGGAVFVELALAAVVFMGLPLATAAKEHIAIDLFERVVPVRLSRIQDGAIFGVCGTALVFLSITLWQKAEFAVLSGETTVALGVPVYLVIYSMASLVILSAFIFLVLAITTVFDHKNSISET